MTTATPVVDLGCHSHPNHQGAPQDSIARLIAKFKPTTVYGFDPHPDLVEGKTRIGRTTVTCTRAAAWTSDGAIGFMADGLSSNIVASHAPYYVPCFDFARWLAGRRVIVKMDIEGAEYALLEHLIAQGRHENIERLLVEWHSVDGGLERRTAIMDALRCPVEEWEPVSA